MLDIAICSIPRMSIYYPPAGPALLKAAAQAYGFTAKTHDWVIDFHNRWYNTDNWDRLDSWMVLDTHDPEVLNIMKQEVARWAEEMLKDKPRWIGISVFSFESHRPARLLCAAIRKASPTTKIVLGGAGLSGDAGEARAMYTDNSLCDEIITGDGESGIVKLLQGEYNGEFNRLEVLDDWPYADFDDYDLDLYKANKQHQRETNQKNVWQGYGNAWYRRDSILTLPLVGSRGCVRRCTFCDIPSLWPRYKTRSAENIAGEVIKQYETWGVQRFHFTDSLINGNMKNFRRLAEILADYRSKHSADFTITGQYICRAADREDQDYYHLLSAAGFKILEVGIESGSEAVRWHMGKKFTNHDVDVFMERLEKADMHCVMLMIVGYPTETLEDHQATMDMFTKYTPYLKSGTIVEACLGGTQHIEPDSALGRDPDLFVPRKADGSLDIFNWSYKHNPDLTFKERIRRRLQLMEHTALLGYASPTNHQEMEILRKRWNSLK